MHVCIPIHSHEYATWAHYCKHIKQKQVVTACNLKTLLKYEKLNFLPLLGHRSGRKFSFSYFNKIFRSVQLILLNIHILIHTYIPKQIQMHILYIDMNV